MFVVGVSPAFVISLAVLLTVVYFGLKKNIEEQEGAEKRKEALRQAAPFLSPYKNIWKSLKLSNKHCILRLGSDGVMITGKEKVEPYRKFRVVSSKVHGYKDLWEMFCLAFRHNMTYDMLIELCDIYKLIVIEENVQAIQSVTQKLESEKKLVLKPIDDSEKIDINNCSEAEMTALPGISIVMSKKAIKRRDEIDGFKTTEEFFSFLKLKPHIQEQLRTKIIVKKKKGSLQRKLNTERQIDL
jgi:DNA uptake protein ComE-like DNA-binding protein